MTDHEKIIDKMRKLRAHQKSAEDIGNEAEAQAFALRFQELMSKHKIDMSDIEWEEHKKETPIVRVYVSHRRADLKTGKVRVSWMLNLARQIGIVHQCTILLITSTRDFFYVGEKLDAEASKEVYEYMVKVAETMAQKAYVKFFYECRDLGDVTLARGFKQSFLHGFTLRLKQRYDENQKKLEVGETGTALMRLSGALKRAKDSLENDPNLDTVKTSSSAKIDNLFGYAEGVDTANRVKFGAQELKA